MFHCTGQIPKLNATFYTVAFAQQPVCQTFAFAPVLTCPVFYAEARSSFVTVWVCCTWFRAITKPQSQNPYIALW